MAKKTKRTIFNNIDALVKSISSDFKGSIDATINEKDVEFETTNIVGLDNILGGGRPLGRIVEVFGPESAGKTGMALHMMGICQRLGGTVALIDAEFAYDPKYANTHHIDTEKLILIHPDCGEDALNITERLVESGKVDIITIDSVSALTPKAEIDGAMGDSHMGLQARMMSQALRKMAAKIYKSNCTVIFINQIRTKIGVMFGNPESTSGGNALKFYASIRLDVRKKEWIGDKTNPLGIVQRVKAVKNKVAPPFKSVMLNLHFDKGYSVAEDLLSQCENFGIIVNGKYEGERVTLKEIKTNKELRGKLKKEVRECFNNQESVESEE